MLTIFEKMVEIELATGGSEAPAATATNPASKAYSIMSCPCVSCQIFHRQSQRASFIERSPVDSWVSKIDGANRIDATKWSIL